jgi:hypothetical protein
MNQPTRTPLPDDEPTDDLAAPAGSADGDEGHACGDPHCGDHHEMLTPFRRELPKVGRNDPCPCGSGKKHKKCCLGASA